MGTGLATAAVDLSLAHRTLWNEVAQGLGVGVRWNTAQTPHQITGYGDLYIPPEAHAKYGLEGVPFNGASALHADIHRVHTALEARRITAVRNSLCETVLWPTDPDLSHLTAAERELITRLLVAVPILKELDILFKDDRGLEFWDYLQCQGDADSQRLFAKLAQNVGYHSRPAEERPLASPVPYFPNRRPTYGTALPTSLVPADLSEADFEAMMAVVTSTHEDAMYNPWLSPLTTVERDSSELGWRAVKINKDPRFAGRLEKLAEIVLYAAQTPGLDESLRDQLLQVVEGLRNDDPLSMYADDEKWVKQASGNLEVMVGPAAAYGPMGKVNGASLFIGVERAGEADFLKQHLEPLLPELEEKFADLIGRDVYQPRTIQWADSVVRVVDVIVSSGAKFFPTLAFVGPDSGPVGMRGQAKRIIIANHHEAKAKTVLLPIAELALAPDLIPLVSAQHFVMNSSAHEETHPLGPRPDQTVLVEGRKTRLRDALGNSLYDSIEESKANVGGLVALAFMRDRGVGGVDAHYVRQSYVTYVVGLMRQMRFGGRAHGGGATAEMGWLFQERAVTIQQTTVGDHQEMRLHIDFAKMEIALEKLWGHIGRIQATGNRAAAEAYLRTVVPKNIPAELDQIFARITAANIPVDVEMVYPDLG